MLVQYCGRRFRLLAVAALLVATIAAGRSSAQTTNVVTFGKVLEYVQLEVSEAKIEKIVKDSGTLFVLGGGQISALRQAGASDHLIEFLQRKNTPAEVGGDVTEFVLILDCSGSMNDKLAGGGSKWQAARQAAIDLVNSVPEGRKLALIIYGRDVERQCKSVDTVRPLTELSGGDKVELTEFIGSLKAVGHTPIARSLQFAGNELTNAVGMASVVLITDGMETCHADPAAEAAKLVDRFAKVRASVHVIGFCLGEKESRQVAEIARAGKGEFYDSKNAADLVASVRKIERKLVKAKLFEEVNLEGLSVVDRVLIEQLGDPSTTVRETAAQMVRQRKVTAAVPALAKLILEAPWGTGLWGDEDRKAAIAALVELAPDKVGPVLSEALNHERSKVRTWAATAIQEYKISDALPAVEQRLQAMGDDDISHTLIQGTLEADTLFDVLKKLNPVRLEIVVAQLMQGSSSHKRSWAAGKVNDLK